ncbi:hypothetical protein D3C84_1217820 [compost metagenome]
MSVATNVPTAAPLSSVALRLPSTATGRSFTASILIVIVAIFESDLPSLTLNVKLSAPFAFALGV